MRRTRSRLAARRENVVWRAEDASGAYALRLHRPGYRNAAELLSELQWMDALVQGGLNVPRPVPSRAGALVEEVGDTLVDLLTWLPGRPIGMQGAVGGDGPRRSVPRPWGACWPGCMASATPGRRPPVSPGPPGTVRGCWGIARSGGRFWDNPGLTARAARHAAGRARPGRCASGARSRPGLDYGLIHADALSENILIHDGALSLIDFDDGGWGFRDFELATFLMRFLPAPDYADMRAALLDGYATRRAVDPATLDLFILLRALTYPGWIIPRLHEPGGDARSARAIRTALPLAEAYLATP